MQYFLTILAAPDGEAYDPAADTIDEWLKEGEERGIRVTGNRLRPLDDATLVRRRNGELLVTDGPYTEGKEHLGGCCIVNAPDLDAALEWGRKAARATTLPVEVRPFQGEH